MLIEKLRNELGSLVECSAIILAPCSSETKIIGLCDSLSIISILELPSIKDAILSLPVIASPALRTYLDSHSAARASISSFNSAKEASTVILYCSHVVCMLEIDCFIFSKLASIVEMVVCNAVIVAFMLDICVVCVSSIALMFVTSTTRASI